MVNPREIDLRLAIGEPVADEPLPMTCPKLIHEGRIGQRDATQSLRVYEKNLHCFGCGFHTSRKQLYASLALLLGLWDGVSDDYKPAMLAKAQAERFVRTGKPASRNVMSVPPLSQVLWRGYEQFLWSPARIHRVRDYLMDERGFTEETIHAAHLGHDGTRFVIPVFDVSGTRVLTYRYRRDDYYDEEGPKYSGTRDYNQPVLYPLHLMVDWSDIVIVEGEFDALMLWQHDISAVTVTNGASQSWRVPDLLHAASPKVRRVSIATDMDGAGLVERGKIRGEAEKFGWGVQEWTWSRKYGKDISEVLVNGFRRRISGACLGEPGRGAASGEPERIDCDEC